MNRPHHGSTDDDLRVNQLLVCRTRSTLEIGRTLAGYLRRAPELILVDNNVPVFIGSLGDSSTQYSRQNVGVDATRIRSTTLIL